MRDGYTIDHAREALQYLDAGRDRATWHRYGTAAVAAGLSLEDIDDWSSQGANYGGTSDVHSAFKGVTPDGGIGPGTLFYFAQAEGWKPSQTVFAPDVAAPSVRNRPSHRPAAPGKTSRPGDGASEVWRRLEPATEVHPYIVSKSGIPEGLRVVPTGDPLRIAGKSVAGWLAVPVAQLSSETAEPVSMQFIPPPGEGKKLNLPGAPMAGVFIVGDILTGGTTFVCEGIGQAWACWKATGTAAVVCFGWGRVRAVAAELRQRDSAARLVLVPDVGKEKDAEVIAREVSGSTAELPEGWPTNSDVNDFALSEGFDALEVLLSNALDPAKLEPRFKLLGSADLHALPRLAWRVRGVLPAVGLASVYGASASGKSFLALDMAAAIAEGREWFGYRVNAAPVVYCALEGEAGFRLRVEAWEQANRRTLPDGLRLVLQPFKLTEPQDVADMAAAVCGAGAGAVTILDTLNRAAPEADENASADMGRILEAAKELQRRTGGLVVAVHHSGKDATKGLRGHSSLFAALDAAVEVTRDGERREWKVAKAKDGADGEAHPFKLRVVELGLDIDGEPATSCVVCRDDSATEVKRAKTPQGGNQRLVYDAIRDLFKGGLTGKPGAPPLRPCIELEVALIAGAGRLTCPTDKRTSRARDAITGLVARGVLGLNEGWLWLV